MTSEQNTYNAVGAMYDGLMVHCRELYPGKQHLDWAELTDMDRLMVTNASYDVMTFMGVLGSMRIKEHDDPYLAARILKQVMADAMAKIQVRGK